MASFGRSAWATNDKLNQSNLNAERAAQMQYASDVAYENAPLIDMRRYGVGGVLTDPDGATATAIAANPAGGNLHYPRGTWTVNGSYNTTTAPFMVSGEGQRATVLQQTVARPEPMFTLWRSGDGAGATIRYIHIRGTGVSTAKIDASNVGSAPNSVGVVFRDHCSADHVTIDRFGTNAVSDGNHIYWNRCWFRDGKWNVDFSHERGNGIGSSSRTHGDNVAVACDFSAAGEACFNIAGHAKIDASVFLKCHWGWAPKGIQAQPQAAVNTGFGASAAQEACINNTTFEGCSFESCGKRYIDDLGYNTSGRRLWKGLHWYDQHDGPLNASATSDGVVGTELVRCGRIVDWIIHSNVGDGAIGTFSYTGTQSAFLAEQYDGLTMYDIDQLWSDSNGNGRPMFRVGGGLGNRVASIALTLQRKYLLVIVKNNSGVTPVDGELAQSTSFGEFWNDGFGASVQKYANATTPSLGRFAGVPAVLATGLLVPVIVYNQASVVPCTDATVTPGCRLTPDATNAGVKKLTLATEQPIGYALDNKVGSTLLCSIDGWLKPVI